MTQFHYYLNTTITLVNSQKKSKVFQLIWGNFGVLIPGIMLVLLNQVNFLNYSQVHMKQAIQRPGFWTNQ